MVYQCILQDLRNNPVLLRLVWGCVQVLDNVCNLDQVKQCTTRLSVVEVFVVQFCLQCVTQVFPWVVFQDDFAIAHGIANVNLVSLIASTAACYTLLSYDIAYATLASMATMLVSVFNCERTVSLFYSKYKKNQVFAGLLWGTVA